MPTQSRRYLAYMLRLWQVGGEGESSWWASLESPRTGERRGFANLEALVAFLEGQTRPAGKSDASTVESGRFRGTR